MKTIMFITLCFCLASCRTGIDRNAPISLRVVRTQGDGYNYYQPLKVGESLIRLSGNDTQFSFWNEFIDYSQSQDGQGKASQFRMVLTDTADSSLEITSTSRKSVYWDLNGDSILDAMFFSGPKGYRSYIVHKNQWVEVRNSKLHWRDRGKVKSLDKKENYQFVDGAWNKLEH